MTHRGHDDISAHRGPENVLLFSRTPAVDNGYGRSMSASTTQHKSTGLVL